MSLKKFACEITDDKVKKITTAQVGIDICTISDILRYKNLQTTMVYTHIVKELNKDNVKSPLDF